MAKRNVNFPPKVKEIAELFTDLCLDTNSAKDKRNYAISLSGMFIERAGYDLDDKIKMAEFIVSEFKRMKDSENNAKKN